MSPAHMLLALMVVVIWALNFVVVAVGLHSLPPILLLVLRFSVAALPVLVLPRPSIPWTRLVLIAFALFMLQFGFLFTAMAHGVTPGMASILLQSQAVFTAVLSAIVLRERPSARQIVGMGIALFGLGLVGSTVGSDGITAGGVLLALLAAASWSVGNILLRGAGQQSMPAMMAWLSLICVPPLLCVSLMLEGGPRSIAHVLTGVTWTGVGAVLYIAVGSTSIGYGLWGKLLRHYSATTVAPFALLVPILAAAASSLLLGEHFGRLRLVGMAIILAGIATIVIPSRALGNRRGASISASDPPEGRTQQEALLAAEKGD